MTDVHEWTSDLVFVAGLAILATAIVLRDPVPSPVRIAVVLPLLLFLPGYALVSALFPDRPTEGSPGRQGKRSVDAVERFVVSIALSVAITPGVALVANFTTGISARPVALGLLIVTISCVVLAVIARVRTPSETRFRLDGRAVVTDLHERSFTTTGRTLRRSGLFEAETNAQRLLNVVLVLALVVFSASVGFAALGVQSPAKDATFTEFYLAGENENGELTTEAFPEEFTRGEAKPIYVGIENHEQQQMTYTTVVLVQRVGEDGAVTESSRLDTFSVTLEPGSTEGTQRQIAPDLAGDRLRLTFLLYRGDAPADPTQANAYRSTRVWISVGGGQGALDAPTTGTTGATN